MSSAPIFKLQLTADRPVVSHLLQAVLGSIIFHRAIGNCKPDIFEFCGLTFPAINDPSLTSIIHTQIEALAKALDSSAESPTKLSLLLSFYPTPRAPPSTHSSNHPTPSQSGVQNALGWFSASTKAVLGTSIGIGGSTPHGKEEDYGEPWEHWLIQLSVNRGTLYVAGIGGTKLAREEFLKKQLSSFLLRLITYGFDPKTTVQVPPITTSDMMPFGISFQINPSSSVISQISKEKDDDRRVLSKKDARLFPELHRIGIVGK